MKLCPSSVIQSYPRHSSALPTPSRSWSGDHAFVSGVLRHIKSIWLYSSLPIVDYEVLQMRYLVNF